MTPVIVWQNVLIYTFIILAIVFWALGMVLGSIAFSKPINDVESRKKGLIKVALFCCLGTIAGFIALSVFDPTKTETAIFISSCFIFFILICFGIWYLQILFVYKHILGKWIKFRDDKKD